MLSGPMLLPASSTWEVITGPRCKVCIMKLSHFRGSPQSASRMIRAARLWFTVIPCGRRDVQMDYFRFAVIRAQSDGSLHSPVPWR
jgi:hypothetical protein